MRRGKGKSSLADAEVIPGPSSWYSGTAPLLVQRTTLVGIHNHVAELLTSLGEKLSEGSGQGLSMTARASATVQATHDTVENAVYAFNEGDYDKALLDLMAAQEMLLNAKWYYEQYPDELWEDR